MAKVLKEAKDNPNLWRMEVTCKGGNGWKQKPGRVPCRRLIEINELDILYRDYKSYNEIERDYGFICPECKCFTMIPEGDIPFDVKETAQKYSEPCEE